MTSPVTQTGTAGAWTVSFMMPREYTRDRLPQPRDTRIRFVETDPLQKLTYTFSGWATGRRLSHAETALRAHAHRKGLTILGPVQYAYYDDPMTLPWKRRNEVAFRVA